MIDFLTNKKTLGAFLAGFVACFTLFSTLVMGPADMWRWLLNSSSSGEKVERALDEPSLEILRLKDEIRMLNSNVVNKIDEFNSVNEYYRKENVKLKDSLEDLSNKLIVLNKKLNSLQNEYNEKNLEISSLISKNIVLENKNGELTAAIKSVGIKKNQKYSFILKEQEFIQGRPIVYFDGKLSVTAVNVYYDQSLINICQFFPEKEEVTFWLYKGKPQIINIAGSKYIIHLMDGSTNNRSILSTFIAP